MVVLVSGLRSNAAARPVELIQKSSWDGVLSDLCALAFEPAGVLFLILLG
jgi:hypothetical protein